MSRYLLDTSVLLDWLRDRPTRATATVADLRSTPADVALTQAVVMEVLMGAPVGTEARTSRLLARFPQLGIDPHRDFVTAAELYRSVARGGHTVRSSTDCLIAAVAVRTGAVLVHRDRDFRRLAAVTPTLHCLDTLDDAVRS